MTDDSDLDILVDALPDATLLDLGAIQVELEDLLGVPVDVVTPQDLSPKFRIAVLRAAHGMKCETTSTASNGLR